MKSKYLLILISIGLIFLLYFIAGLSNPIELSSYDQGNLANYANRIVRLEGTVIESKVTDFGSQLVKIKSKGDTVMVFLQYANPRIREGDGVIARGKIQNYKGKWELLVTSEKDLEVKQSLAKLVSLQELASSPKQWERLKIKVTGKATSPHPYYFYLQSEDDRYKLEVLAPLPKDVVGGDKVTVVGIFSWDKERFGYYLDARSSDCFIFEEEG
jgi:DNA/RNA endonuclease YhcR with UshA esterase domain